MFILHVSVILRRWDFFGKRLKRPKFVNKRYQNGSISGVKKSHNACVSPNVHVYKIRACVPLGKTKSAFNE